MNGVEKIKMEIKEHNEKNVGLNLRVCLKIAEDINDSLLIKGINKLLKKDGLDGTLVAGLRLIMDLVDESHIYEDSDYWLDYSSDINWIIRHIGEGVDCSKDIDVLVEDLQKWTDI